jgi:hypothetical protein
MTLNMAIVKKKTVHAKTSQKITNALVDGMAKHLKQKGVLKAPKEIDIVVYIYWFLFAISIVFLLKENKEQLPIIIFSSLIVFAVTYWVTKKIKQGLNWMRTLLLVTTVLNTIIEIKQIASLDANSIFTLVVSLILLLLLYSKPSNVFFKASSPSTSQLIGYVFKFYKEYGVKITLIIFAFFSIWITIAFLYKN